MKNKDLYQIQADLIALNAAGGAKLSFVIGKNLKIIKDELASLEASFKPDDRYNEFQTKRMELCATHSKKNEDGSPVMVNNRFDIIDMNTFSEEFGFLKDEYKKVIEAHTNKEEDYKNLLNEETTLEFTKINIDLIPDTYQRKDEDDSCLYNRPIGPLLINLYPLISE